MFHLFEVDLQYPNILSEIPISHVYISHNPISWLISLKSHCCSQNFTGWIPLVLVEPTCPRCRHWQVRCRLDCWIRKRQKRPWDPSIKRLKNRGTPETSSIWEPKDWKPTNRRSKNTKTPRIFLVKSEKTPCLDWIYPTYRWRSRRLEGMRCGHKDLNQTYNVIYIYIIIIIYTHPYYTIHHI